MHLYSFDFRDPVVDLGPWKLSVQVVTLENVYGLDPARLAVSAEDDGWTVRGERLSWAGGQQHAAGTVELRARRGPGRRLRVAIEASAPHKIRAIKLLIRALPPLMALDLLEHDEPRPADGAIYRYPNSLRIPLLLARTPDGALLGARCEDPHARAKRFALYQERMGPLAGTTTLECIHEEDARWFDTRICVPEWVLDAGVDAAAFRDEQLAFAEAALGLARWEQRADMPAWAREIRLCLTLHGMHWSGYVFNTYDQMLEAIRFAAERIGGRHVLAYLPGWEGRYYWQYGDYRPEPRLGGRTASPGCATARGRSARTSCRCSAPTAPMPGRPASTPSARHHT